MTDMQQYTPVQVPARVGQATAVEQSRAAAEVMAAVQVALSFPRDEVRSEMRMRSACRSQALAKRAFYSFPRAGGRVTGPTVQLARELARCWGNIHYGVAELSRDDALGQSEMQAWAWDLETNERVSTTFIVPHGRDTKEGVSKLKELRDIYENNANAGARRLREMIMAVLPVQYREEGIELCQQALNNRGTSEVPIGRQRVDVVDRYAQQGIEKSALERHLGGRTADTWNRDDLATLNVLYEEIGAGKLQASEVFGAAPLQDADVKSQPQPGAAWPVQPYQGAQGQPAPSESLPESVTWPVVRQVGGGREWQPGVRREQAQDTQPVDDYDGSLFQEGE